MSAPQWTIVGQGLAGTCLAWEFWKRSVDFRIIDRETGGSSRVAAGLLNPITGKNFEPSARIADFLPDALEFYAEMEKQLSSQIWHPLPVLRLADTDKEWRKMVSKFQIPEVAKWLVPDCKPIEVDGWAGAIEVHGGGRIDTRGFLDGSRDFFKACGIYQKSDKPPATGRIECEGAAGLISNKYGPHRCAKGEILTIRAGGWDDSRIHVGAGGWLVPLGQGIFKAGSTYEWHELDETPTENGRSRVIQIIERLGGTNFEIIRHDAGIRPILRRSEPLIGPLDDGNWMFNGLGSKGGLYAPGMAKRLANWIFDDIEPEKEVDFRCFRAS